MSQTNSLRILYFYLCPHREKKMINLKKKKSLPIPNLIFSISVTLNTFFFLRHHKIIYKLRLKKKVTVARTPQPYVI